VFRFGRKDGSEIGRVTLAAEGAIAGYRNDNERSWSVVEGRLAFYNAEKETTTIFDRVGDVEGGWAFLGDFLLAGEVAWHTLHEIVASKPERVLDQLATELYGGESPFEYADPTHIDQGYPHTNLIPDVIRAVLDTAQPRFWLEIGTMLGGSAIHVAELVKAAKLPTDVICIDPFCGDVNMWAWEQPDRKAGKWRHLRLERGRPTIYDRFLANVRSSGHQDCILPIVATSIVGIKLLKRLLAERRIDRLPDVIYLDSAHEEGETFLELQTCWDLLGSGGILIGDDWSWDAVRSDVTRFARTVALNATLVERLETAHPDFSTHENVLLDRGQWLLAK